MDKYILAKRFGSIVYQNYKKPFGWLLLYFFLEFVKNPFGCIFIFFTGFFIRHKAKSQALEPTATWEVIKSSKNIE